MGTPGKERQKKYIERQRQLGRNTVTVLLSQKTKEILDRERAKTGENFSAVLEKALLCYDAYLAPKTTPPPAAAKKQRKSATGDKLRQDVKKKKKLSNQSSFEFI